MAVQGYSVHFGLNRVDPAKYDGWSGPLRGCENDARAMQTLACSQGFQDSRLFLTESATRSALKGVLDEYAARCQPGDFFFLTSSSHGSQVPSRRVLDAPPDETDGKNETICLYDGEWIDDEFVPHWANFKEGVRILFFSDSCHSGTVSRMLPEDARAEIERLIAGGEFRLRGMPDEVLTALIRAQPDRFADRIRLSREEREQRLADIAATVMLISGCQDNQNSMDGPVNGVFTDMILKVWDNGAFRGDYRAFHEAIQKRMARSQQPNLFVIGKDGEAFLAQRPFQI